MATIERLKQADEFYVPAIYDFLFLKKHFHEAETHNAFDSIDFPIFKNGILVDTIRDEVRFPDLFHFIQTSFAFLEKGLKYLIFLESETKTIADVENYKHSLNKLLNEFSIRYEKEFSELKEKEILETIKTLSEIDFVNFRYFSSKKIQPINAIKLKDVNIFFMELIKQKRYEKAYKEESIMHIMKKFFDESPRVYVECPVLELPKKFLDGSYLSKIEVSPRLNIDEKQLVFANYFKNKDFKNSFDLNENIDDFTKRKLFEILRKEDIVTIDYNTISIKFHPPSRMK